MKYWILCGLVYTQTLFGMDHFDYYRNLHLRYNTAKIKEIVQSVCEYIPADEYDELLFHIDVMQEILCQPMEVYDH